MPRQEFVSVLKAGYSLATQYGITPADNTYYG